MTKVKSISADELNQERLGYIHFSVTKDGRFRCQGGEDRYGKDCHFRTFALLESLGRHYEANHLKAVNVHRLVKKATRKKQNARVTKRK